MPEISVIIPVYNVEKYLRECLDSVAAQTLRDLEILCIDDGSTDRSGQILDEYATRDERFVIVHQPNAGQSAARNRGLDLATGEFVAFLDSDDWLDPTAMDEAYQAILRDGNQADVAFFLFRFVGFPRRKRALRIPEKTVFTTDAERMRVVQDTLCTIWSRLYRRSFLAAEGVRFPTGLNFEDNYFAYVTALAAKRIVAVPKCLYNYRCAGYSNDPKQKRKQMDRIEVWTLLVEEVRRRDFPPEVEQQLTRRKLETCSHVFRRIPTPAQKPECRRRIENAITADEWRRLDSGELRLSLKHRCFFHRFRRGWWSMLWWLLRSGFGRW